MSLPTDAAQMARDGGVTTPKLGNNAFSTDKLFQIGQGQFIGRDNLQSGTGNVAATQSYPDISLTSALSAPFNATTAWSSLSAYLNQVAATNINSRSIYIQPLNINVGGGSGTKIVLAPNGKFYAAPQEANKMFYTLVDPETDTATTFGTITNGAASPFGTCCLGPNGKVYYGGGRFGQFAVVNPSNNTASSLTPTFGIDSAVFGMILAPNGKIYCSPFTGTMFYIIDPATDTVSSLLFGPATPPVAPSNGYYAIWAQCLAPTGRIYCSTGGYASQSILTIIDPNTNTTSTFTFPGGPAGYLKCILHPNGKIYYITGGLPVGIVDPFNNTTRTIAGPTAGNYWALGSNGNFYSTPNSSFTFVSIIDPYSETITSLGVSGIPSGASFVGMMMAPNGSFYAVRNDSVNVWLKIGFLNNNNNFNKNSLMGPFYNGS